MLSGTVRLHGINKVAYATLWRFSLTSLHNGYAIVRPFVRVMKDFLRKSRANLRNLNRRGYSRLFWLIRSVRSLLPSGSIVAVVRYRCNPDGSIVASLRCRIRRGRCPHRPYSLRRGRCPHRPVFQCYNHINAIGHDNILTNMPIIKFCVDIVDVLLGDRSNFIQ